MERNDLAQDFLLHKMPRPITSCAFVVREKIFDAVVIQRGHVVRVPVMRASLPVARREHNAPPLRPTQRLEPEQHLMPTLMAALIQSFITCSLAMMAFWIVEIFTLVLIIAHSNISSAGKCFSSTSSAIYQSCSTS
jgi:hypothetical protein